MIDRDRLVADTNVLVSRFILRESIAGQAVGLGLRRFNLLRSNQTLEELATVLRRPKFARYGPQAERDSFVRLIRRLSLNVDPLEDMHLCRDPKDDKFLALAVAGQASVILTGDQDLLSMHPFRGIAILSPRQFLNLYGPPRS